MDDRLTIDRIMATVRPLCGPEPFEDALAVLPSMLARDEAGAVARARWLRERAMDETARCRDQETARRCADAAESILLLVAPFDFDSYMLYMEWGREPAKRFYLPRRRVLYPIVQDLQDLADGKLDFLAVSLPPRVGKSTMCIFFLTWMMGRHPDRANVMSGHSDKLTKGFHMEALGIISDHDTYRFADVFPEARLVDKSFADETIHLQKKRRFPSLTCRSIDGTLTGAVEVGRDALLYCDDLVSDREEALNVDRMDKLYSAYLNQLRDRKLDGAKELHVGTRWVPNDVIGRIEAAHAGDPRYRFTSLPALDAEGRTNFEYQWSLGFSTRYYEDMRRALVDAGEEDSWLAKYMCAPVWIGGRMFAADELRWYDELPPGEPDGVMAVCDTKDRGRDYCCMPVAYVYGNDYYIEDCVCDDAQMREVEPKLVAALVRNNVGVARFESNSAGGRVADDVERACRERGLSCSFGKRYSTENKETRILTDSMWIKERCLFRNASPSSDYDAFLRQLHAYSTEGKNKHDDAPDAMSMLRRLVQSSKLATVEAVRRIT